MRARKKGGAAKRWIFVLLVLGACGAGFFRREIAAMWQSHVAHRPASAPEAVAVQKSESTGGKPRAAKASPTAAAPAKGKFTFFPDARSQYAWSVKYPDGRTYPLGDEFSSDCTPSVGVAKNPATVRLTFTEQRSCEAATRRAVPVDEESLHDVDGDGIPKIVSAIVAGGNIHGHTSFLIALAPNGPQVLRRLD